MKRNSIKEFIIGKTYVLDTFWKKAVFLMGFVFIGAVLFALIVILLGGIK